jgi:hypothetical protein
MSSVDGTWDCVMSSPMGDQQSVMELKSAGSGVTGTVTNNYEKLEITDGAFDGKTFTWKMVASFPFKMDMSGKVAVDGDAFTGGVGVGFFGTSDIRGKRRAG